MRGSHRHHSGVTERVFPVPTVTHKEQSTWRIPVLFRPGVGQALPWPSDHVRALRGSWCLCIPRGPRSSGQPCFRISCCQNSSEKAVDTSPSSPTSPRPGRCSGTQSGKRGEKEGRFLEGMHHHFEATSSEASGDLPSGWVGGGRQKGPCTFPRTLVGQNHSPGLTISSRVWGSGLKCLKEVTTQKACV